MPVGPTVSFLPGVLATVTCFDVICLFLLAGDYVDSGDRRILVTSWAYLWSLVTMGGYALAFPGVISAHPPLATAPSVAPYLYICWHAGFPLMLGAAWAPWPHRLTRQTRRDRRHSELLSTALVVAAVTAVVVATVVRFVTSWPVLIVGIDVSRMVRVTAPVAIPLVLVALGLTWHGLRNRLGPERWAAVAVLVCLCDLILTYAARYRYSVGWYGGRTLTMLAAAVLLVAMLASFRRLKATAEFNAAFDSLTGLSNRRGAHAALAGAVARARRSGAPLALIALDLDHFKDVNDRFGHPVGDTVLAAVGAALTANVRDGDLAARVGGEEFLVLLPDTGGSTATLVAERLRQAIAGLEVAAGPGLAKASLGVTCLGPQDNDAGDLLRRADGALYTAKDSGRNRVVTLPSPGVSMTSSAR